MREEGPRIAVLIKAVVDPTAVTIDGTSGIVTVGPERVLNTYDAYGLATAIDLKEQHGATVTAMAAGPVATQDVLLRSLAIGADLAIWLDTGDQHQLESLELARLLAGLITDRGFDLVIAGQSTEDYESGQTGPQVAELLGLPHVSLVTQVDLEGRELTINRDAEGTKDVVAVDLPAMLMVLTGRNGEQRYPTLRGMMTARKQGVERVSVAGPQTSGRMTWSEPRAVQREAHGEILSDVPPAEAASRLIVWLKEKRLI